MVPLSQILLLIASTVGNPHPGSLVGQYDGHRMEMAAGLDLKADGHFQYGSSYGAVDEEAEGTWYFNGVHIVLSSHRVNPPRFTFLAQTTAERGIIHIDLQVPIGTDRQYFRAVIVLADGTATDRQLASDGLSLPLAGGRLPKSVQIVLPMFDIASDPIAVDLAKGLNFAFRFEPNDLGHASFDGAKLEIKDNELILTRYGTQIHFRRIAN